MQFINVEQASLLSFSNWTACNCDPRLPERFQLGRSFTVDFSNLMMRYCDCKNASLASIQIGGSQRTGELILLVASSVVDADSHDFGSLYYMELLGRIL